MGRISWAAGVALILGACPLAHAPAFAQTAQGVPDTPSARLALAYEVIDLGLPKNMREAMFSKVMDQMTAQMRQATVQNIKTDDAEAIAILDAWLAKWVASSKVRLRTHVPALMDGWAAAYADIYTVQELTDIRAFVSTPSGAAFMQKMQDVLGNPKFAVANQAYMTDMMGQLPAAQAELMAQLTAHFEKKQRGS